MITCGTLSFRAVMNCRIYFGTAKPIGCDHVTIGVRAGENANAVLRT